MTEEDIIAELSKLRYPTEEDGWIKRPQNGLPSYRILRKSLKASGIKPELTWDKEECMKAIPGGSPVPERIFNDKTSDALYSSLQKMMNQQNRSIHKIQSATDALIPQIESKIKEKENALIKKQLDMMK